MIDKIVDVRLQVRDITKVYSSHRVVPADSQLIRLINEVGLSLEDERFQNLCFCHSCASAPSICTQIRCVSHVQRDTLEEKEEDDKTRGNHPPLHKKKKSSQSKSSTK